MGTVAHYLQHALGISKQRWCPLLSVYYITHTCSFRCPYCSDGEGRPYWSLPTPKLDALLVLQVLTALRRTSDYLVITGGEPCEYPYLDEVLGALPSLGWKGVVLTTNGHTLDRHIEMLSPALTELVLSVDTLDAAKADACYGVGAGALNQILANADAASRVPNKSYDVVISIVITPHNLDDLHDVCEYAWRRGWRVAACPQLQGVKAHPAVANDERYRRFFDFLIEQKRALRPVEGTIPYLQQMRDLGPFKCRPFTMVAAAPNGDVYYPCLERGQIAGNLLEDGDLHRLRQMGEERFGPPPRCGVQCHSACALGFATILSQPSALVAEAWWQVRRAMRKRAAGRG